MVNFVYLTEVNDQREVMDKEQWKSLNKHLFKTGYRNFKISRLANEVPTSALGFRI